MSFNPCSPSSRKLTPARFWSSMMPALVAPGYLWLSASRPDLPGSARGYCVRTARRYARQLERDHRPNGDERVRWRDAGPGVTA
jgi:hypothetical protein